MKFNHFLRRGQGKSTFFLEAVFNFLNLTMGTAERRFKLLSHFRNFIPHLRFNWNEFLKCVMTFFGLDKRFS